MARRGILVCCLYVLRMQRFAAECLCFTFVGLHVNSVVQAATYRLHGIGSFTCPQCGPCKLQGDYARLQWLAHEQKYKDLASVNTLAFQKSFADCHRSIYTTEKARQHVPDTSQRHRREDKR